MKKPRYKIGDEVDGRISGIYYNSEKDEVSYQLAGMLPAITVEESNLSDVDEFAQGYGEEPRYKIGWKTPTGKRIVGIEKMKDGYSYLLEETRVVAMDERDLWAEENR